MEWSFVFFFNSILLGIGLAMDAFSVSLANGLNEPCMKRSKMCGVAGLFAVFQGLMPLIGWICIHTIVQYFTAFETLIPWIALALLTFIGGKMLIEGIQNPTSCEEKPPVGFGALVVQGIATSIDALAVGISLAMAGNVNIWAAAALIGVTTCALSALGVKIGNIFGSRFEKKAEAAGGIILILLGVKILLEHLGVL